MSDRLDIRSGDLHPDSAEAWPAYRCELQQVVLELVAGVQQVGCFVLFADVVDFVGKSKGVRLKVRKAIRK